MLKNVKEFTSRKLMLGMHATIKIFSHVLNPLIMATSTWLNSNREYIENNFNFLKSIEKKYKEILYVYL